MFPFSLSGLCLIFLAARMIKLILLMSWRTVHVLDRLLIIQVPDVITIRVRKYNQNVVQKIYSFDIICLICTTDC